MKWGLTTRRAENNQPVDLFTREIDSFFNDFFNWEPVVFGGEWTPTLEVKEDDKALYVNAELPGLDEKELSVTLEHNVLTISGERKEEREEGDKEKNYHFSERRYGSFSRSIAVPDGIKADQIAAEYKNGLLKITLPKSEEAQPKKINITVN